MKNLMFITDDITELEATEKKLEERGIPRSHIHVFTKHEADLEKRDIPSLNDFSKRDVVRSGIYGAALGALLSGALVVVSWLMGWTEGIGVVPVSFLSVAIFGFCTWEGGLWGIQSVNHKFDKFKRELASGSFILIVDATDSEVSVVKETVDQYKGFHTVTS